MPLLGGAQLRQRPGPLATHRLAVHLPLLLSPDRARLPERPQLPVPPDRHASPTAPLAPRVPRHLIHLVEVNSAALAPVFPHGAPHADHPGGVIARAVADYLVIRARPAQLSLEFVPAFDGPGERGFLPAVQFIGDEFRLRLLAEPDPHVPAVHLLRGAVDAAHAPVTRLRHRFYSTHLAY
jgi:hypothetical protein